MNKIFLKGLILVSTLVTTGLVSCAPHEHVGGTATCTDLAICEECGEGYGELLPHEHTTVKFDETNHWDECVCGDKINVTAHNWVAGEITKTPTCTEDGTQAYSCTYGATKTEVVPSEGHDHSITEYDEENDCFWIPECWYEVNSVEDNGNWIIDSDYDVTHWMPLPEAPKMKGGAE